MKLKIWLHKSDFIVGDLITSIASDQSPVEMLKVFRWSYDVFAPIP